MKTLFLLDAYALIYRAYYAFIRTPRYTSGGLNTSAILGFTNVLLEVLEKQNPSHIAVVFDPKGNTFRHKEFEEYKAQRPPMPDDIRIAVPYIKRIIEGFRIPCLSVDGYEADDVIGTLAKKAEGDGFQVFMMTPDKDFAQLVTENIFMFKPKRGGKEEEIWGVEEVKSAFGVENPIQVIDILGLMGDSADNIPGCPGIGPKNAEKIIAKYGNIENIYNHIEEFKGKQKENIVTYKNQILDSKYLATIKLDVPIEFDTEALKKEEANMEVLQNLFKELEFATLSRRLFDKTAVVKNSEETEILKTPLQGSLFDDGNFGFTAETVSQPLPMQEFFLMDTPELRQDLRADMCLQKQFALNLVLSEEDTEKATILGFSVALEENEAYYVPTKNIEILHEFHHIFTDEKLTLIAHDCKQILMAFFWQGIEVKNQLWDILLAHYVLQPELRHSMEHISQQLLSYIPTRFEDLLGKGRDKKRAEELNMETLKKYSAEQSSICLKLQKKIAPMLKERQVENLYYDVEIPLLSVLAQMECNGASIDTDILSNYNKELQKELNDIEVEIKEMAEEPTLNVSSPKQLGDILFEKLKLNSKAKKTASGQYSTAENVLVKLKDKHPIVGKILQYRSLAKLISTYVEALPTYISEKTKRIHTNFNQAETATGRLSSTNPNLQNIPIRTAQGRYIRKAFIPSDENHIFLSADYSQIELRIMAHISGDMQMQEAFNKNEDIHAATASKIFKVSLDEVTSEMRRQAKTANFGIIYGISSWGLAERLDISRTEGKQLIDGYFSSYPQVKDFMDKSIFDAREKGYVETLMHRRRYLNDINSGNAIVRGVAERNAINAPIQGSAADIIKVAMIRIAAAMKKANLKSEMILQVHDELNFNCLRIEEQQLKEIIKEEMENAVKLTIPLVAKIGAGKNWLEAH